AGTYKVLWKTVSADDGDSDDGDFSFTVRAAAAAPAASPAAVAPAASPIAVPAAQAAPVAKPAGQPSPSPVAVQAPRGLPQTGSADPNGWIAWLVLGGVLVLAGAGILRRVRSA